MDHASARQILYDAFVRVKGREPSYLELAFSQAVALLETGYGRAGQFGNMAAQGMFNWGALQTVPMKDGTCPVGTYGGKDAGNARCFYYASSDEGAADSFLRTLLKPMTLAAMATANPDAVAAAMKSYRYFEAGVENYAASLRARVLEAGYTLPTPSRSTIIAAGIGLGTVAAILTYFGLRYALRRHA